MNNRTTKLGFSLDTASGNKLQAEESQMQAVLQVMKQEVGKKINHTN